MTLVLRTFPTFTPQAEFSKS